MGRVILIGIVILTISGCFGKKPIEITTDVKEQMVEILYSPAPPVIIRPELPIHQMTPEQLAIDGVVVKYYKATIKTLIGYSTELRTALDKYDDINKAYEAEKLKVEEGIAKRKAERELQTDGK